MAEKSDSRDSDSSWVLAGTEVRGRGPPPGGEGCGEPAGASCCPSPQGLPVDTVGPEQDAAPHEAEEEEAEEESAQDTAMGTRTGQARQCPVLWHGEPAHRPPLPLPSW